ncbi:MAG: phosphoenolpyruvate--protein phosphotransferase [Chloroflexi bacterium]|nr:phosphoenolpyruvate--protein phosphotransferase [Chloroflexota bacterium]
MKSVEGLSASPGVAIGAAWFYQPVELGYTRRIDADHAIELNRLQDALSQSKSQLTTVVKKTLDEIGEDEAKIFEAHLMFLDDPELIATVKQKISLSLNAEAAVEEAVDGFAKTLLAMDSEYFKARAADVLDVGRRIIACLVGVDLGVMDFPVNPVVVFADDLSPSDTMQFQKDKILGFCIRRGGPTSHAAILARSLGIPSVVSAAFENEWVASADQVIMYGDTGKIIINPEKAQLLEARAVQTKKAETWKSDLQHATEPAITTDGHVVEVVANVGSLEDAEQAVLYGAEGIGLLRTEFLYLDRDSMPTLEEQTQIYKKILTVMGTRPVVVRTLDIGGDKPVSYLGLEAEPNPFLGWRAIRMINERPELLRDQFSALLQATSLNTDLRIMLPLISNVNEVINAREIFNEAKQALDNQGEKYAQKIQFGIMVEVPSAALLVDQIAPFVDFYSIGTNDLAQYTLAVDRTNERVASLASPFHPAVIQLIAQTIDRAHVNGKWVGLCGEMAGNTIATPLLIGLGLDEFSMAPVAIPTIKNNIRHLNLEECKKIAEHIRTLATTKEVLGFLAKK